MKAIRILGNSGCSDTCRHLIALFSIMTLPSLYIYNSLLEIRKILSNLLPHMLTFTRNSYNIRIPRFRISISHKNSPYLNLYNVLPHQMRMPSMNKFKRKIHSYLLNYAL